MAENGGKHRSPGGLRGKTGISGANSRFPVCAVQKTAPGGGKMVFSEGSRVIDAAVTAAASGGEPVTKVANATAYIKHYK
jgi:hypothetical protein